MYLVRINYELILKCYENYSLCKMSALYIFSGPKETLNIVIFFQPHSTIVSRAAFLLECSYFVHSCNKGHWPTWMKLNLPVYRPSGPLPPKGNHSGLRRSHIMQRSAGKMFYQWAEVRQEKNSIPLHSLNVFFFSFWVKDWRKW